MASDLACPTSPLPNPIKDGKFHGQWKFTEVESEERYNEPGGFHPVQLGDTFNNGRYKAIRKLGFGTYSTVWLAVDNNSSDFVAFKILSSYTCGVEYPPSAFLDQIGERFKKYLRRESFTPRQIHIELEIYARLHAIADDNPRSDHILLPIEAFPHSGPNGVHQCIVFPLMGPTVQLQAYKLPDEIYSRVPRYPLRMIKRILTQVLHGLAFLHGAGIVHGDLHKANVLFGLKSMAGVTEASLAQDKEMTAKVLSLEGQKLDEDSPRHMWDLQPLYDFVDISENFLVKISDLGMAFHSAYPPLKSYTATYSATPESILGGPLGPAIDIWSFGCLLGDLLVGQSIFKTPYSTTDDLEELLLIHHYQMFEPLPDYLMSKWPRGQKFFKWYERWGKERNENGEEIIRDNAVDNGDDEKQAASPRRGQGDEKENGEEIVGKKAVNNGDDGKQGDEKDICEKIIEDKAADNSDDGKKGASPKKEQDEEEKDEDKDEKKKDEEKKDEEKAVDNSDDGKQSASPGKGQDDENEFEWCHPIERCLEDWKPIYISEEEIKVIGALFRKIFRTDPNDRPSAEDLLKDPWFSS